VSPGDGNVQLSTAAHYFIAAAHFNSRDATYVPQLAALTANCTTMFVNVTSYCDTSGSEQRAVLGVLQAAGATSAVVGGTELTETWGLGTAADADAVPLMTPYSTIMRFADRGSFPLTARTIPDDQATATLAFALVARLNYTAVGLAYDTALQMVPIASLQTIALAANVSAVVGGFDAAVQSSVQAAFQQLAQTQLNVVVVAADPTQSLPELAAAANASGLLAASTLFVFCKAVPRAVLRAMAPTLDPLSASMLNGSVFVTYDVESSPAFQAYSAAWASGAFSFAVPAANAVLPPQGYANSTATCANDAYDLQLDPASYFADTAAVANAGWAFIYDTVVTLGLAACAASTPTKLASGSALYAAINNVQFQGLSGSVSFATGERSAATVPFSAVNVQLDAQGALVALVDVAAAPVGGAWAWVAVPDGAVFRDGTAAVPPQVTPPTPDLNLLSSALRALAYAETALVVAAAGASAAWVVARRELPIVDNAGAHWLVALCLGVALMGATVTALSVDDSGGLDPDSACTAGAFTFALGATAVNGALLGVLGRVTEGHADTRAMRTAVVKSERAAGAAAAAGVAAQLVLLIAWTASGQGPTWVRTVTSADAFGLPIDSYGACLGNGPGTIGFAGAVCAVYVLTGVGLMLASWRALRVRAPFQESSAAAGSALLATQIVLVSVPSFAATYDQPTGRFLVASTAIVLDAAAVLAAMIGAKLLVLNYGEDAVFGSSSYAVASASRGITSKQVVVSAPALVPSSGGVDPPAVTSTGADAESPRTAQSWRTLSGTLLPTLASLSPLRARGGKARGTVDELAVVAAGGAE